MDMTTIVVAASSINRNILECKAVILSERNELKCVLIETYWNVKAIESR